MGNLGFVEALIEKKLMDLHCGYIGKVIWTDGVTATVQPLGLIKERGGTAMAQAVVSNVPVGCKYKFTPEDITYMVNVNGGTATKTVAVPVMIAEGDLVACLCADRDITEAKAGKNELPPSGYHSISDSIIVGIL